MTVPLLSIENLSVAYRGDGGTVQALRGVSLRAYADEVIGIVGESGCGKSTLVAALIGLMAANAQVTGGAVRFRCRDILALPERDKRMIRGRDIAMVFQDPMTSLSPVITIGDQMVDYQHHLSDLSRRDKRARAERMLESVGIADAAVCMRRYPHELSGGMRQRTAMAAALLMTPDVLVADEPTTALDVTMEAQILHLLRELRADYHGAIVVVTHHLGVIGEICDRVYVMYAGQIVEEGPVDDIYHAPRHPYTSALIACDPGYLTEHTPVLPTIPGRPPDLAAPPPGCGFAPRCPRAVALCHATPPPWVRVSPRQAALCHLVRP
jgi:oligopeptide/dipeptide ABC transporter ATP-binding protein